MTVNYAIQAEVVNIRSDTPKSNDVFLVDTNVWYWMTYPNATSYIPNKLVDYPQYLNKALAVGSLIYHSGLSLEELSHLIEKTEREIYEQSVQAIKPKEYRHNLSGERSRVVSEIKAAWGQVTSMADPLTITIDEETENSALNWLQSGKVDGYDLFILESMIEHSVLSVITDDGDFSTVPGIQVFTANRDVLDTARSQGKLLTR